MQHEDACAWYALLVQSVKKETKKEVVEF